MSREPIQQELLADVHAVRDYLCEWRRESANASELDKLDTAIATVFDIYSQFIKCGYKWDGLLPVLSGDLDYMVETLSASTVLSLTIATEGLKSFTRSLSGDHYKRTNSRDRMLEWMRLNDFARRLNCDFSLQISVKKQRNRTCSLRVH
ncbi:hypothetical protein LRX75_21775 [Rhizobium sp. DKSPLA3]|uniref:Uncharacterized protein n=1 Tax=Rhizobium quercicola TaxID=2901226 RepID=A0A9X1NWI3_9HYPH|nr:hypothetical protein [Rhizobium quercicola]MCD7111665.1 hypothetical protein [Rhizobium quercicola]